MIGLLAITAIPTVTGVGNAVSADQRQQAAAKDQVKFFLIAMIQLGGEYQEGAFLLVDLPDYPARGCRFNGYYFKYLSKEEYMGLVSTISDDPPILNWIYVDKDTGLVRYGRRKDTIGHVIGPWHWSEDEELLTLKEDYDPFMAKREEGEGGRWCVYWDLEHKMGDCLRLRLRRKMQRGVESRYVRDK